MSTVDDALDAAWETPEKPRVRNFFGKLHLDAYHVTFEEEAEGKYKKVHYDPSRHPEDRRLQELKLEIYPLSNAPTKTTIVREMLSTHADFQRTLKPSLAKLGVGLRQVNNQWVQVEARPTSKYTDKKTGEEKDHTALAIVAVYATEGECQAAADALFKRTGNGSANGSPPAPPAPPVLNAMPPEAARILLATLWQGSGRNQTAFLAVIKTTPGISHLDLSSPEVVAAMEGR